MNDAKRDVVRASTTSEEQAAKEVLESWPSDLILSADLGALMAGPDGKAPLPRTLQVVAQDAGLIACPKPLKFNGKTARYYIVRNREVWEEHASKPSHCDKMRDEIRRGRGGLKDHETYDSPTRGMLAWLGAVLNVDLDLDGGGGFDTSRASGGTSNVIDMRTRAVNRLEARPYDAVPLYGAVWGSW